MDTDKLEASFKHAFLEIVPPGKLGKICRHYLSGGHTALPHEALSSGRAPFHSAFAYVVIQQAPHLSYAAARAEPSATRGAALTNNTARRENPVDPLPQLTRN